MAAFSIVCLPTLVMDNMKNFKKIQMHTFFIEDVNITFIYQMITSLNTKGE
jgi:hypothetical protein